MSAEIGTKMKKIRMYEPEMVAALVGNTRARDVYHNAGHAVAAGAMGGKLLWASPGVLDWTGSDAWCDIAGDTEHLTDDEHQPFVAFAGPCAEALWECHVGCDSLSWPQRDDLKWLHCAVAGVLKGRLDLAPSLRHAASVMTT
jgi:hypothetical protein